MKKLTINTNGINYIEPLEGNCEWYWGTDHMSGDLYEAEEIFRQGYPVKQNRLLLIHYPDGTAIQPFVAKQGQYFGRPIYDNDKIILLIADFIADQIELLQCDAASGQTTQMASIPLSGIEDCYNLMLKKSPLMLTRQGSDHKFQILWPENITFPITNTEAFSYRIGEKLYFQAWYEDPDYREEVIVRKLDTGEIIDRFTGSSMIMPDGQIWILT